MAPMLKVVFWISVGSLIYIYLGYPFIVNLFRHFSRNEVKKTPYLPEVTIVIAAYNEENHIGNTLANKLSLEYPREKVEIIVVSDGSTDRTDAIVKSYEGDGVRLLRQEPRGGKTAALNMAIRESGGEIIVFSDANSLYATDALLHLTANFADDAVGYVTGKLIYGKADGSTMGDGCSLYMRYENNLREAETCIGSIVGVNGGIDAVRKRLYEPMTPAQLPDFVLPLKVVEKGFRVVYEPDAILREDALKQTSDEYRMRVRVALRSLYAIVDMKHLMNPMKYGIFSWQFLSHKTLRYLAFIPLAIAYACGLALIGQGGAYLAAFATQTLLYLLAITGWFAVKANKESRFLYAPLYFCLLNVASADAFFKMLQGKRQVVWNPRKG
jgi:cellulose synthase/poly-beta-1,6-N-acetylglucosamine synthase-like glycosyltransferase